MKTFTIENETNNITVCATVQEAEAVANAERFRSETGLGKLAANWPASRLVDIWNSLSGVTAVRKFKDRATAVNRIWKALQSLGRSAPTDAPGQHKAVRPLAIAQESEPVTAKGQPAPATTGLISADPVPATATSPTPVTPKTHKGTDRKPKAAPTKKTLLSTTNTVPPREGSKACKVVEMLRRTGGTTLQEIMTAMGWQKHTTRAMLSAGGSLTKKHGLGITSEKVGNERTYSIKD